MNILKLPLDEPLAAPGHNEDGWLDELRIRGPSDRRICKLVLAGESLAEIAKDMNVGYQTVRNHLTKIYWRFGIEDGVRIVKLAVLLHRTKRRREQREKLVATCNDSDAGRVHGVQPSPRNARPPIHPAL